ALSAVLWRIAQLPIVFQVFIWISLLTVLFVGVAFILRRIVSRPLNSQTLVVAYVTAAVISTFFVFLIILDAKELIRQRESELLQNQIIPRRALTAEEKEKLPASLSSIGDLQWTTLLDTTGISVFQAQCTEPLIKFTLAQVDLRMVEIKMDSSVAVKEKTSAFAKMHECILAINGEAGTAPDMNAEFGQWMGNYVIDGKPIFLEDDKHRPFLAFNRQNHGTYSPEEIVDVILDENKFNTIWGRYDCVVQGKTAVSPHDLSVMAKYPRTLMGIDSAGYALTLIIVDGRMPGHSVGMMMHQCAELMLSLGVFNGMACDQGGSSCFYLQNTGIINRPCEGGERPVYTHFGVKIRG
ncbi:MAG: phosphodiester glycosidase family protein, partial [Flavobacteriales bacterium]